MRHSIRRRLQKLVLMDAPLPGIGDAWEKIYNDPRLWHFHFVNSPIALKLVTGRERTFLDHFWISFSGNPDAVAIPEEDRKAYTIAYAQKGAIAGRFRLFHRLSPGCRRQQTVRERGANCPCLSLFSKANARWAARSPHRRMRWLATCIPSFLKDAGHWPHGRAAQRSANGAPGVFAPLRFNGRQIATGKIREGDGVRKGRVDLTAGFGVLNGGSAKDTGAPEAKETLHTGTGMARRTSRMGVAELGIAHEKNEEAAQMVAEQPLRRCRPALRGERYRAAARPWHSGRAGSGRAAR